VASKRPHISLTTKLAATLLEISHLRAKLDLAREEEIPYEDSKLMTAAQINSLFTFDHYPIRHVDGGPVEPWNLVPRFIGAHRTKTAKVDQPQIAKDRAIARKEQQFRERLLAKDEGVTYVVLDRRKRPKRKIQSRPFPKRKP